MIDRREFIAASAAGALLSSTASFVSAQDEAPRRVVLGIMGLSRGLELASDLVKMPGVEIRYACDTDSQRAEQGAKRIEEMGGQAKPTQDFRNILDDKEVDALVCAAPNHWHGPATILGCKAGKHVYVEKPCSHNPQEGEWMIEAASKYKRCVQMGTQRRSAPKVHEAIQKIQNGAIGKVYMARCFYNRDRQPIGKKPASQPPAHLDYEMWQGPAPRKPYHENIVHYNWHWFWHYGNGEIGNNGPHHLDVCRWGLQVDYPTRVLSSGGRYCYDDDQETPDTHTVAYEFEGGKQITFQGLSCTAHAAGPFAMFYGVDGALEIDGDGSYRIYDKRNKVTETVKSAGWGQAEHLANFVAAVRSGSPSQLNQPILEGHKSTLLCHLGNIAQRTNSIVHTDPKNGHILNSAEQQSLWRRQYDPKWESEIVNI